MDFPGVVQNAEAAIACLGGPAAVASVLGSDSKASELALRFRCRRRPRPSLRLKLRPALACVAAHLADFPRSTAGPETRSRTRSRGGARLHRACCSGSPGTLDGPAVLGNCVQARFSLTHAPPAQAAWPALQQRGCGSRVPHIPLPGAGRHAVCVCGHGRRRCAGAALLPQPSQASQPVIAPRLGSATRLTGEPSTIPEAFPGALTPDT